MRFFPTLLISFIAFNSYSQSLIQGKINDSGYKPIPYANVLLKNKLDSIMVKGAITDETGSYIFTDVTKGEYFVEAIFLGYAKSYSDEFSYSGTGKYDLSLIQLKEEDTSLEEVMVSATRPLFEMEMGKLVVNVANNVTSAGFSVIDLLERSPGVLVNRQNNTMSLAGKNGVVILMNGKRFRMPLEAAYQMLAGLNSSDVEKIEIITIPPANYDADGDAGFINVVMKRNNAILGTNGSVTLGQGYGSGYNGNLSFNLNHQGPKFNWFTLISTSYVDQVQIWESDRTNSNEFEEVNINTFSDRQSNRKAINYQAGFDYLIGKNTTISGLVSGYDNEWNMIAPTTTEATYSISPDTLINMNTTELNSWHHMMGNINLLHKFQNDQVLNANLDYLRYSNSNPSQYETNFQSENGDFLYAEKFRISKDTPINIWVADLSYSTPIGKSIKMDSGVKGTFSKFTNDVIFEENIDSQWIIDSKLSSEGLLSEDILAAFTTLAIELDDKTTFNAGLRFEHTKTNLSSVSGEVLVDRNYGNLFPNIILSRKLNPNSQLTMSYGRRITRPTFNQMAPFVFFSDRYTFFAGNQNILPTYTNNIKTDFSYKSWLFSAQYSRDKNAIVAFQPSIDEETNIAILRTENINQIQTVSLMMAFPLQPTPWWEIQSNVTGNFQSVNSELSGEMYQVNLVTISTTMTNTFTLPKKYIIELLGNYSSPSVNGYFNWLSRGFVNLGIRKDFEKAGTLRLACNDIFETTQLRWNSFEGSNTDFSGRLKFEKRVFMATYTYNFGNNKVKGTRNRAVGSQAEQRRVTN